MAMTDEEIRSRAAQLNAARRRKIEKHCEVCGEPFEGLAQRRYCSDQCRNRASRLRTRQGRPALFSDADLDRLMELAAQREGESMVEHFDRIRELISRGRVFEDSTEILRREREKRSKHLASL